MYMYIYKYSRNEFSVEAGSLIGLRFDREYDREYDRDRARHYVQCISNILTVRAD